MNRKQWEKAKQIFERAIHLDRGKRPGYLRKACGRERAMRAEIENLLAEYDRASSFLEQSSGNGGFSSGPVVPSPAMFAAGQVVASRFQVAKFIGAGGMGEVYEALDRQLKKTVALKVIPSGLVSASAIERLKREVCFAHEISHPNVCRVFDLGHYFSKELGTRVVFLTMELLPGETLRAKLQHAPMQREEALPIILQIAKALAAFHAQNIVHRDLKPSNVILVPGKENGVRAVVTDFGVARPAGDTGRTAYNFTKDLTGKGQIVGTLDYMAPEQLTAEEITPATDVYAMGLMMYEMLVGKKPFAEENPFAAACRRFKGLPVSTSALASAIGADLASLILNCLAVSPGDRPANGRALVETIERQVPPFQEELRAAVNPSAGRFSIVVLPFASKNHDHEDEYFSSGLTDELTLLLTKIEGLRVIAPTSSSRFQPAKGDIPGSLRELKAQAVLMGAVRRSGDTLRVGVQLVNAEEECLWAERYDRQMKDVFLIQEEIANAIAAQLPTKLRGARGPQFVQHRTQDMEAYKFFLKGRFFAGKRTPSNLQKAREHFRQSLQHDPHFAPAFAAAADCCVIQGVYGLQPPREVFPAAKETLFKALALAPHMTEAHCSAACIQAIYDWDWTSAERSFQRALELDPNYATAHHAYALYCLVPQGRFAQARSHIERALANDPLSLAINASNAVLSYFERRYDDAIRECKEVLEMDANFGMAYFFLGQAYEQKGLYPEAINALEKAVDLTERSAEALAWLGRAWALAGESRQVHSLSEELTRLASIQYVSPVLFAQLLLGLKETDAALDHLEEACALRAADLIWIGVRPVFDGLRSHARFQEICKQIGFPASRATSA